MLFLEQAQFFPAEQTESWWEDDLKSQIHTARSAEEAQSRVGDTRLAHSTPASAHTHRPQLSISSKGAEKQTVEGCGQPVREMKAQGRFS